jgi:hypothetical protein
MFTVKKEIELDVEKLVENLEYFLKGRLDEWANITTIDADYIIDGKPEHFDSLMIEIGKEIINKHTHNREE